MSTKKVEDFFEKNLQISEWQIRTDCLVKHKTIRFFFWIRDAIQFTSNIKLKNPLNTSSSFTAQLWVRWLEVLKYLILIEKGSRLLKNGNDFLQCRDCLYFCEVSKNSSLSSHLLHMAETLEWIDVSKDSAAFDFKLILITISYEKTKQYVRQVFH